MLATRLEFGTAIINLKQLTVGWCRRPDGSGFKVLVTNGLDGGTGIKRSVLSNHVDRLW